MMPIAHSFDRFKENLTSKNRNTSFREFVGSSRAKDILAGIFARNVGEKDRAKILVSIRDNAELSKVLPPITQSTVASLASGKGHNDVFWAYYYWLHRYHPETVGLADVDREVLGGAETYVETFGQYVDGSPYTSTGPLSPPLTNNFDARPTGTLKPQPARSLALLGVSALALIVAILFIREADGFLIQSGLSPSGPLESSSDLANELFSNALEAQKNEDEDSYFKLMSRAASEGHTVAKAFIAIAYASGYGSIKDPEISEEFAKAALGNGLESLAAEGDASAQYALGLMHLRGIGVKQDDATGIKYLKKAKVNGFARASLHLGTEAYYSQDEADDCGGFEDAQLAEDAGHIAAAELVGSYFELGKCVDQSNQMAIEWYRKAAERGDEEAQTNLGWMYESGDVNGQPDYETAAELYHLAADQNYARAQASIGRMYELGYIDGEPGYEKAVEWYRKAANQGFSWAQNRLGSMYEMGRVDGEPDYERALEWYRKAANQDFPRAEASLGWMYEKGYIDGEPDYAKAIEWYRKAANQDLPWAQNRLGWMYEKGNVDGDPNYEMAEGLYQKAAEQGYAPAKTNLAWLIQSGHVDGRNNADAFRLFSEAAADGDDWSLTSLGMAYLYGYGTEVNLKLAASFCRRGAADGSICGNYCAGSVYFFQGAEQIVEKAEAQRRLSDAANSGHHCSATLLALAIYFGEFPSQNPIDDAEKYLRVAAEHGSAPEKYNLGLFLVQARGQSLTEDTEARQLVSDSGLQGDVRGACEMAKVFLSLREVDRDNAFLQSFGQFEVLAEANVLSEVEIGQAMRGQYEIASALLDGVSTGFRHRDFSESSNDYWFSGNPNEMPVDIDTQGSNVHAATNAQ